MYLNFYVEKEKEKVRKPDCCLQELKFTFTGLWDIESKRN
jgi:hypothetical protein